MPTKKPRYKKNRGNVRHIMFKRESDLPLAAVSLSDTGYNKTGKWRSIRPVIDYQKCVSCMMCWKFCPDAAVKIAKKKPRIALDYCKGCAICAEECPVKAIRLEEEKK